MTAIKKAMSAYGQATETIPPAQQIVMLYDGVLRFVKAAKAAVIDRRINDRYMAIQKATTIIEALQGCLDHDKGGDIALQLDRLYTHFVFRLQAVNMKDDPAICDELVERIGELRSSWAAIAAAEPGNGRGSSPSAEPARPQTNQGLAAAVTA